MVQLAAEFGSDLRVKRDVLTSKRDLLTSKRDLLTSKRDLLSAGLHCPCDVAHSDKSSAFLFIVILHGNCTRALSLENPCLHCDAPVTSAAGWEVLGRGDDLCECVCVCVCLCVCVVCSCAAVADALAGLWSRTVTVLLLLLPASGAEHEGL